MRRGSRGGRFGGGGRGSSPPAAAHVSSRPAGAAAQLQELVGAAMAKRADQGSRLRALQALAAELRSEAGAGAAAPQLAQLWPRLLALLSEPAPQLRQAAASVVGLLGAVAAKAPPTAQLSLPRSVLFDWGLPLLAPGGGSGGVSAQFWAAAALTQGAAALPDGLLRPWAAAMLAAAEQLLDAEDTQPMLLQPLLGLVAQAGRHTPALQARVRVLVDILLGWALDPDALEGTRPAVANALASFKAAWPAGDFTGELAGKLLADMRALVGADASAASSTVKATRPTAQSPGEAAADLRRFLGFSCCLAAVCRACAAGLRGILPGYGELLARALGCLAAGHARFAGLLSAGEGAEAMQEELCVHADTLLTVAATVPLLPAEQSAAAATQTQAQVADAYPQLLELVLGMLGAAGASVAGIAATLRLHARVLQLIGKQQASPPEAALQRLLDPDSAFSRLRLHTDPGVLRLLGQSHAWLLQSGPQAAFACALQRSMAELRTCALEPGCKALQAREGRAAEQRALAGFSLGVLAPLLRPGTEEGRRAAVHEELWACCLPGGCLSGDWRLHTRALSLLQAAPPAADSDAELPARLRSLVAAESPQQVCCLALAWLAQQPASPGTGSALWQAVAAAAADARPAVRRAAGDALSAASAQQPGVGGLETAALAAERLSDLDAGVRQAWDAALRTAGPHPPLSGGCAADTANAPGWVRPLALQPQPPLKAPQLANLLAHLTGSGGGWEPGLSLTQRLLRLHDSCCLQLPAEDAQSQPASVRAAASKAALDWWAAHAAASSLINARLRTAWGGPQQTLAGLEAGLRRALQGGLPLRQEAGRVPRLLLQLLDALERGVQAAADGCGERPEASAEARAFFASSRKVCSDWFARVRPLLTQLAAWLGERTAVLAHASAAVAELRRAAQALLQAGARERQEGGEAAARQRGGRTLGPAEPQPKALLRRAEDDSKGSDGLAEARRPLPPGRQLARELNACLQAAAEAAAQLGESALLAGLHAHCLRAFAPLQELLASEGAPEGSIAALLAWLPPAQLQAGGRAEAAAAACCELFEAAAGGSARLPEQGLSFAVRSGGEALAAAGDWAGLQAFHARLEELRGSNSGPRLPAAALSIPRPLANAQLAAAAYARREWGSAAGLAALSQWAPLTGTVSDAEPASLASAADGGVLRALLALQQGGDGQGGWRQALDAAVREGQAAALEQCRLAAQPGGGSGLQAPLARLQMLRALQLHAGGQPVRLAAGSADPRTDSYAELLQLRLQPSGWPPACPGPRELPGWQRVAALTDASDSTTAQLAAAAAVAGNASLAARILASTGAGVEGRLRCESAALRLCLLAGERPIQPPAADFAAWAQQPPPDAPAAAALCLQLAECVAAGAAAAPALSALDLGTWEAAESPDAPADGASPLRLLLLAAQLAPDSAAVWAGLANWLHGRLEAAPRQEGPEAAALRSLAATASCRRLATAQPAGDAMAAAPELLRLLRAAEAGLAAAETAALEQLPPRLWQPLVPQLLSQLASEQEHMRRLAAGLLERLEGALPSTVLYPALAEWQAPARHAAHAAAVRELLECCRRRDAAQLAQVEAVAAALARVTVLPTEEWHAALTELQADIAKRAATVRAEAARLQAQAALSAEERARLLRERFATVMAPARVALQRRLVRWEAAQKQQPTPHEAWFARHFLPRLQALAGALQSPGAEALAAPEQLGEQARALARAVGASLSDTRLSLASVAPGLARLQGSAVPMPGRSTPDSRAGETVAAFGGEVELLHTRTRPKRLVLVAASGRRCAFLLKGREDLRLDARTAQLLQLAHSLLAADPCARGSRLGVRRFAVTPLSAGGGLVEWVPATTPVFQVYADWQAAREARAAAAAAEAGQEQSPARKRRQTPVEAFYAKLLPALQAAGVDRLASRKQWPAPVLRQVLLELAAEVPRSLLERRIWGGSAGPADWWARQQAHARSTAAISMVGWLLGLGDRHLGNILLDTRTAEAVHIDLGIVWERGRRLPVPELVPFRLTPVLQGALGVTGVEGCFRSSCCAALACLRRNAPALQLLAAAVLRDCLVDWAPARASAAADKAMELGVRLNLLCSRTDEIEPQLAAAAAALQAAAAAHGPALDAFLRALRPAVQTASVAHEARLEAARAQEELAACGSRLQQQWQRAQAAAAERGQAAAALDSARSAAAGLIAELAATSDGLAAAWGRLRTAEVPELQTPLELWLSGRAAAPLGLLDVGLSAGGSVAAGLELAGPLPPLVAEACEAADARGRALLQQRDAALYACVSACKELSQAARSLLGEGHWRTCQHARWAAALTAAAKAGSAEAFAAAARLAPAEGSPNAQLQATWEALERAAACQQPMPEEAPGSLPLAILRADANAAEREVAQLRPDSDRQLQDALAAAAARLLAAVEPSPAEEATAAGLEAALQATLDTALQAAALAAAPHPAVQQLPQAQAAARPLKAAVACAAGLLTAARMGTGAFLPELAGFAAVPPSAADQGLAEQLTQAAAGASALQHEASQLAASRAGSGTSEPSTQQELSPQEQALQARSRALVGAFNACLAPADQPATAVPGLAAGLQGLHGLLAKLRVPLASLQQGEQAGDCLQGFAFDFTCMRLLAAVAPSSQASEAGPKAALQRMEGAFHAALAELLAGTLRPGLRASLLSLAQAGGEAQAGGSDAEALARQEQLLARFAAARAAQQAAELAEKRREAAAAVRARQAGARRRQAACEWLAPEVAAAAAAAGCSQLRALQDQGALPEGLRGRAELVRALHVAVKSAAAAAAELAAWRAQASLPAEQALAAAVRRCAPAQLPSLQARLKQREEWLARAAEHAAALQALGEGQLRLEASRDGKDWRGGSVLPAAACEGAAALLQAQHSRFLAMYAADGVVAAAREESQRLQTAAAELAARGPACESRAAAAGSHFLALAPALAAASLQMPAAAEAAAGELRAAEQPLQEAAAALQGLCQASVADGMQEALAGAAELQGAAARLLAMLRQAREGLPALAAVVRGVPLPPTQQLQAGGLDGRQLAAVAAAIVDAAVPALGALPQQGLDLAAEAGKAAELGVQLGALRSAASGRADAIQQEHGLQGELAGAGSEGPSSLSSSARPEPVALDPSRAAARQAFAEAALQRFCAKLSSDLSTEAQVEKLLQQAASPDSLARMYEGWTPWI